MGFTLHFKGEINHSWTQSTDAVRDSKMATPASVSTLVAQFDDHSLTSDADSGATSPTHTNATDTPTSTDTPLVFRPPTRCFGLVKHKTKGLVPCLKAPCQDEHYAFCGRAHYKQCQATCTNPEETLLYKLIAFLNARRTDLLSEFVEEVVPYFTLKIARGL